MYGSIKHFLKDLDCYNRTTEADDGWTYWGFTIYRTYYGPSSDQQWSQLLTNISNGVAENLSDMNEADKNPDAVTKALRHYRMDARSDPAMEGSIIEDVRHFYLSASGGEP